MTTDLAATDDELREPLRQWLAARNPGMEALELGPVEQPQSGFSAKTIFVPIAYQRSGTTVEEKLVVRLENPEPAIYPQQVPGLDVEIDIQYRSMKALLGAGRVPLAQVFGYEPDASILGHPFFVMEYVAGNVMIEHPAYTQEGFFAEARPADREAIITNAMHALADFHTVDWRAAGFDWLLAPGEEPTVERQIDLWEAMARRELGDRIHPDLDCGFRYLHDHAPAGLSPGLSWGDARPGNIIFRGNECGCLTDFENISIAPVEIDLGYWLMFDRSMHEAIETKRPGGEPTREEQRAIYADRAGKKIAETYYFEVLGAVRYAAIVVRVMNRLVVRGGLPENHVIWLHNPAAMALGQLLADSAGG